jgi:hypothetical protein
MHGRACSPSNLINQGPVFGKERLFAESIDSSIQYSGFLPRDTVFKLFHGLLSLGAWKMGRLEVGKT